MKTRMFTQAFLGLALIGWLVGAATPVLANDMPTAAGSPIAGITFDDRPLMLPVQRNFQMAMLTASSELGRSCGKMEAYGWRMESQEQDRVNQLFNNTVDRMRAQGFAVESKTSNSISRDVTLFTADRSDRHLIFLWSAGEIGLVMVLCETSAPLSPIPLNNAHTSDVPSQPTNLPNFVPSAKTVRTSNQPAQQLTGAGKQIHASFSPVGDWVGNYTCSQGTTGATLHVASVKGDQFEGFFSFYPTAKNPYVPNGKYLVFGEYDSDSQRILLNPGKWINRPKDYYSTIMIGSFDPVNKTFSGYFQGITGCTSFEATNDKSDYEATASHKKLKAKTTVKKPKAKKSKVEKPKTTETNVDKAAEPVKASPTTSNTPTTTPPTAGEPAPRSSAIEPPAGIVIGAPFSVK